jgi:hypothetical protein
MRRSLLRHFSGNLGGCIFRVGFSSLYLVCLFDSSGLDERNIPALGRIGDPDDILASVMVEDGKVSILYLLITLFLEV